MKPVNQRAYDRSARLKKGYPLASGETPSRPPATRGPSIAERIRGGEVVRGSGRQMADRLSQEKATGEVKRGRK